MDVKDRLRKDNISVSIRRDEYKETLKRLIGLDDSSRDMSEAIWTAVRYFNRRVSKNDRTYREDKTNYRDFLQDGDQSMTQETLRDFIQEHFDVPEDKNLDDKSKAYLQGYLAIRLQGLGVDIGIGELEEVDLSYIVGLLEGSENKVDTAKMINDSKATSREDIEDLREKRLQIGQDREDKSVEELREARKKLYDGIDEEVEKIVEDKEEEGKDEVEALREARFEIFSEGDN